MNYSFMSMPVKPETVKGTDYSQSNIGNNPTVNLAIGRLQYVFQDVGIGTSNFAVSAAHIYSTRLNGKFATMISGLGKNWKLNLTQFVIADNYDSETGLPVLKYFDESGEIHRYVYYSTNKWYNERKATSTIEKVDGNYVLSDGVGNKLYFNANGYLVKSVSCQNSKIVKLYTYDSNNRLTSVYDQRTPKNHIDLTYNADGNLETMIAYASNTHPKSGCRYEYDAENNLVAVFQIAYGSNYQQIAEKQILQFYYANGNLVMVIDPESKGAKAVQYDSDGNVARLSTGIIKENCIESGMTDAAGKPVALGSGVTLGMSCEPDFVEKSFNAFSYRYNEPTDYIAVETEVTNECGITLRYYIDRNASIASSFERDKSFAKSGTNLKTLTKYAGQEAPSNDESTLGYINGCSTFTTRNGKFTCVMAPITTVDNRPKQIYSNFTYSFWLKTKKNYELLEAKVKYKFADKSDERVWEKTVPINAQAVGAWQLVVVPLNLYMSMDLLGVLYNLEISFLANKKECKDVFEINSIGSAPSSITEFLLVNTGFIDLPLSNVKKVNLVSGSNGIVDVNIDEKFYLTESDVICMYTNKNRSTTGVFDLICNNGTKRIPSISDVKFYFDSSNLVNYSGSKPFYINTLFPVSTAGIKTYYNYGSDGFVIENNYIKTIDDQTYNSTTSVKMDYKGNTLCEIDEYGTKKEYVYNADGSLRQVSVTNGSDTQSIVKYTYDSEGNLTTVDDGFNKQEISYNEASQAKRVVDFTYQDTAMAETGRSVANSIGIFGDNQTRVSEYDGWKEVNSKKITYENGQIRTISDGLVKYGVQQNFLTDSVLYTQFDGEVEKPIQRDVVSQYKQDGNNFYKTHTSEFFDESGNVIDASSAEVDAYGRTINVSKGVGQSYQIGSSRETYKYVYPEIQESKFVSKPTSCQSVDTNTAKQYKYDSDGNLIGWSETEGSKTVLDVCQITPNTTKYKFGEDEPEYFVEVNHDKNAMAAPRMESVVVKNDFEGSEKIYSVDYYWDTFGNIKKTTTEKSVESYLYKSLNNTKLLEKINYACNVSGVSARAMEIIDYYDNGMVKREKIMHERYEGAVSVDEMNTDRTFQYDNFHRITKEINTILGICRTYSYYPDGRLKQIAGALSSDVKNFVYDSNGRLVSMGQNKYTYDNFGNRISKTVNGVTKNYTYDVGGRLISCGKVNYYYNADGIRCKKICVSNGIPEKMCLDGGKVIGEDRANYKLRYFYDATGLKRMRMIDDKGTTDYEYVKDSNGSIIMLVDLSIGSIACQYEYDALGNCKIISQENKVGEINPFKWKGFFHDSETGFYYANGSYYDPETGLYVDAAPVSTVFENADYPKHIDRNGPLCYNTLAIAGSPYTVSTTVELKEDLSYNFGEEIHEVTVWWQITSWFNNICCTIGSFWNKMPTEKKFLWGTVLIAVSVLLAFLSAGATIGPTAGMLGTVTVSTALSSAAKFALIELAIGIGFAVAGWALNSALSGSWNSISLANDVVDSVFITGVFMFVSASISAIKYISRAYPNPTQGLVECAGNCFSAGTLVYCEDGKKEIEDIRIGDRVLACDPETGEQAYKTVVCLFRNESCDWIGISVNSEEIISTPGHKYYLPFDNQWKSAFELNVGDTVLLVDGNYAEIQSVRSIQYDIPQITYNIEVEDFHTYYVGSGVLVHNKKCKVEIGNYYVKQEGVKVYVNPGEGMGNVSHNAAHAHVVGNGPDTTVGLNGLPMNNHPAFSKKQSQVIEQNWNTILKIIRKVWP